MAREDPSLTVCGCRSVTRPPIATKVSGNNRATTSGGFPERPQPPHLMTAAATRFSASNTHTARRTDAGLHLVRVLESTRPTSPPSTVLVSPCSHQPPIRQRYERSDRTMDLRHCGN